MKNALMAAPFAISLLLTGCFQAPHAQLVSRIDQMAVPTPQYAHLEQDGQQFGLGVIEGENGAEVEVRRPGTYLVLFSPQVSLQDPNRGGCFTVWLTRNGKDEDGSAAQQCFSPGRPQTTVLTGQFAAAYEPFDRIGIKFNGYNTKTEYTHTETTSYSIDIPSIVVTVVKL